MIIGLVSSIVRRLRTETRVVRRNEQLDAPCVLKVDPNAAIRLAREATRELVEVSVRETKPEQDCPERSPVAASPPQQAELALARSGSCLPWRADAARRAYLSTLPPPPAGEAPRPTCNRWI